MAIRTTKVIGDVTNEGKNAVGQTAPASVIQTVGMFAISSGGNRGKILGVVKFCASSAILHGGTPPSLRTCSPRSVRKSVYIPVDGPCQCPVPAPLIVLRRLLPVGDFLLPIKMFAASPRDSTPSAAAMITTKSSGNRKGQPF
jgi:hypothetical protein